MKIAAQLYTVRDYLKTPSDIAASLQRIKDIGYNAVQASGLGPIDPAELKALTDSVDLEICATHVPYTQLQNDLLSVVEAHHTWGCKYVGIGSMPESYRTNRDGYLSFAEEASNIGRALEKEGLRLIYHNHNFEYAKFDGVTGMDLLMQSFDSSVDFELDVYWVQAGGASPVDWIRKVDGRMKVVHLKDMAVTPSREQLFAEVGEGNFNWPELIQACTDIGVEWGAVEQDKSSGNPFDSLQTSLKNLKSMQVAF